MATNTMVALQTQVLGSSASSVTFTGISQAYTDLVIQYSTFFTTNGADRYVTMQVGNGSIDTGSHYSWTYLDTYGGTVNSGRTANAAFTLTSYSANPTLTNPQTATLQLNNYSNTTTYKTILSRFGSVPSEVGAYVSNWRGMSGSSTEAINTIKFNANGANFDAGSTFTLYGIAAQPVATAKATGGTISYGADGYTYHAFTSSGTFTPTSAVTADILVVAGGGAGGAGNGGYAGGGGAGGLLGFTAQSLTTTGYTVTVGAGGSGVSNASGSNGGDSQFGALTLVKGGGGGGRDGSPGVAGGSSGGAGYTTSATAPSVSGQGYAGGVALNSSKAGGGGAGGPGVTVTANAYPYGQGGIGSSAYSTWGLITGTGQNVNGTYYYAGGGGGSNGGSTGTNGSQLTPGGYGGGGSGGYYTPGDNATSGTSNTGGGGGGQVTAGSSAGGSGGSGLVIVRYAN